MCQFLFNISLKYARWMTGLVESVENTFLTYLPLEKLTGMSQTTLSIAFSWMKRLYIDSNFTDVWSWFFSWQQDSISSVNGLAPNMRQAITCTKRRKPFDVNKVAHIV